MKGDKVMNVASGFIPRLKELSGMKSNAESGNRGMNQLATV
jgi:hypothetical protein